MSEYQVEIVQTAPQGDCEPVRITLVEDESRITFLEIHMSLEEFGRMLHGPTIARARVVTRGLDKLGWRAEHKSEVVPFDGDYRDGEKVKAALAPFEVDGWRGRRGDLGNMHRRTGDGFRVTFDRLVEPIGEDGR